MNKEALPSQNDNILGDPMCNTFFLTLFTGISLRYLEVTKRTIREKHDVFAFLVFLINFLVHFLVH